MILFKYLGVWSSSMLKFIFGPIGGYTLGLSFLETVLLTVAGMMSAVLLVTFLGKKIKLWLKGLYKKPTLLFTKKNRRKVTIWRKYGIKGVAFLTPLLLTPIGGTLTAVSFGEKPNKILFYMLISGAFWAVVFSGAIYIFGQRLLQLIH